ncbi:MAG: tetratricopeptide repeat protein [bacterium]
MSHILISKLRRIAAAMFLVVIFCSMIPSFVISQESRIDKEFNFAKQLFDDSLYVLSAQQFTEFASSYPNHENADMALFLSGEAFYTAGKYKKAFTAYKNLEIQYPQSPKLALGRYRLAQCQLKQNHYLEAGQLFKRLAIFHPESDLAPQAQLAAGRAFAKSNAQKKALNEYFRVVQYYPHSQEQLEARLEIVQIYLQQKRYGDAIAQIDGLFRIYGADMHDPRVFLVQARVFEELGQHDKAEKLYTKLIADFPDSFESQKALYYLGCIFEKNGDFEHALLQFQNISDNSEQREFSSQVALKRGDILTKFGRFEDALQSYERVQSGSPQIRFHAGLKSAEIYSRQKNPALASDILEKIIKTLEGTGSQKNLMTPLLEQAYVAWAHALTKLGSLREALNVIDEFEEKFPKSQQSPVMIFLKAEIYEKSKKFDRAARVYESFIENFNQDIRIDDAQFALGRCYEQEGEYGEAVFEYEKYLNKYPAGDLFDEVKKRKNIIDETIQLKETTSINYLSHMLKQFRDGAGSSNWHYELGKVYHGLKEFKRAIQELKQALSEAPADSTKKDDLYFYLADSYYKVALKKQLTQGKETDSAYLDSAKISLSFLTENHPNSKWSERAFLLLTHIRLDTLNNPAYKLSVLSDIYDAWVARFPDSQSLDYVMVKLANSLIAAPDSDTTQFKEALWRYQRILADFPKSAFREEAFFGEAIAFDSLQADSMAMSKLHDFAKMYPQSRLTPQCLFRLAQLHSETGNEKKAIEYLQLVLSRFFYSDVARKAKIALAELFYKIGDYQSSVEHFNGEKHFSLNEARAYEALGDDAKALTRYIAFIQSNPSHENTIDAMRAVALISRKRNKTAFAKEYYASIINGGGTSLDKYLAYSDLGDLFFEEGLYHEARERYLSAISLSETRARERVPWRQAIRCLYKLKKFTAAEADIKKFKRTYKDTKNEEGQFLVDKAQAYRDEKQFELAIKTYKKLKGRFQKTDYGALGEFGLGAVYLITNHTEDALKILTAIPSKYPNSEVTPLTYLNLGDFYYKSQQIENAIPAFKQVIAHPQAGKHVQSALRYLIKCYNDLKLWDQAIVYTREYLAKYPHADDGFSKQIEIARNLMNLREYDRALDRFQALKLHADAESEAEIQFYLGQCYKEMGDFERAVSEYLKVKYLTKPTKLPWHVTALFEAGDSLLRLGEAVQAKKIFQRILDEQGLESNWGRFAQQKLNDLTDSKLSYEPKEPF